MPEFEKMNPEIKQLWLEALRSGRYEQGEEVLLKKKEYDYNNEETVDISPRYCCLGVLCDLPGSPEKPSDTELPNGETILWAGLGKNTSEGSVAIYLAEMNDGNPGKKITKHTFAQIADWIEANL